MTDLTENIQRSAARPTHRHGELAWFEIYVTDLERSAAFYRAAFGWTFQPLPGFALGGYLLASPTAGGAPIAGLAHSPRSPHPDRESTIGYVFVDDIPGAIDNAVAAGGALHRPHMNIGGDHGYCAIVTDPDGNHVGLWSDH